MPHHAFVWKLFQMCGQVTWERDRRRRGLPLLSGTWAFWVTSIRPWPVRSSACLPYNRSFLFIDSLEEFREWQLWLFGPGIQSECLIVVRASECAWGSALLYLCVWLPWPAAASSQGQWWPPWNSSWHTLSHKKLNYRAIKYLICLMNECVQILKNSLLWLNEIEGWELSFEHFSKRWVRVVTVCPRFGPQE